MADTGSASVLHVVLVRSWSKFQLKNEAVARFASYMLNYNIFKLQTLMCSKLNEQENEMSELIASAISEGSVETARPESSLIAHTKYGSKRRLTKVLAPFDSRKMAKMAKMALPYMYIA